jgi:6-phosphogluconate dehydrogenase
MQQQQQVKADRDIGLIGLAVMGQNLALNIHDKGFKVAVFNRTVSKVDEFLNDAAKGSGIYGAHTIEQFIASLKRPRRIILMVKAGAPVDEFIEHLLPHLEAGDIIIDGGNSLFTDTTRRCNELKKKGIRFVGSGVSGGEEGARHGPSIMPGGDPEAWPFIKPIFQAIAAKVENGDPCCDWVGDQGAGHYVKMVHNGIEYGDMQLICEAYHLMRHGLGLSPKQIGDVFAKWNQGFLNSYLIEITAEIMKVEENGKPLIDKILDVAGQKGTGKWTGINALELGMPVTLIGEAVFARCLSALKEERVLASHSLKGPHGRFQGDVTTLLDHLAHALYASKIISYAQGFMLMREASKEYGWKINYGSVALMWRGGCIIRSQFLGEIKNAYDKSPQLHNLLLDDFFASAIGKAQQGWRAIVTTAVQLGIPMPCMSTALAFYDGYRTENLPANLLQAQRDFFGAHTYERVDKPRGQFFHTNWTGTGGNVSSSSYNA